ncbi:formate transporter FocA [Rodentibacter caecimuris]|uniref:Formate transporter FocA n=1 Tax=Rodentibacter caecimuris TaxID=1796644 RepID=A0A1V3KGQ2_9PAST|nr:MULTISPECIES: formate transporter FocA [Pasteurellaceae]AOF52729.1 Formate efflux transporter [Pasteurellaceae bacterium NI1060]MCQ9123453.1 formate transporter FocA [Rodentibacter heylii]MCR1837239.1 formate transporter FocA [Pasteurella caecimuris]MCU0106258.1 formate transporter FocA [Pasteurella caecimuris]MCX2960855.1 formate transporter FocA [Rodentibacter heylii]
MPDVKNSSIVALTPIEATNFAEDSATYKARKRPLLSFMSGISAGACIALAFVFYTTTQTALVEVSWGLAKLVGGIVFSIGVIMVVLLGAELFTSSTITFIARIAGKITTWQMLRNWIAVYFGNFIGGLIITALIWFGGQTMVANGQWGLTILTVAQHKIHHTWFEAFNLGILCNIMVCLAVWLSYSGKTVVDKAFIMILPIALFVASGFEHCVANMFMIPMGIMTAHYSSPEFWLQLGIEANKYADLNVYNFIVKNLIPVTLGNIVGGAVCVALFQRYLTRSH